MSETDAMADLETQIEEKLNSDESTDNSEVESDTEAEETTKVEESAQEEEEKTSDEDSDDSQEDSETDSEPNFDFHSSKTSINKLVENLKNLSPEERETRISKLTREKEIEAVKEAFPNEAKNESVSRKEYDALLEKIESLKIPDADKLAKALEIAEKLKATEGLTDTKMKDLMLQEQFGDNYKEVANDPKFKTAYDKFPSLSIEEKLEVACSLSPVARKLATDTEVKKQVRLKSTKTVTKGKQETSKNEMTTKDVKNLDDFEKLLENKFD